PVAREVLGEIVDAGVEAVQHLVAGGELRVTARSRCAQDALVLSAVPLHRVDRAAERTREPLRASLAPLLRNPDGVLVREPTLDRISREELRGRARAGRAVGA